MGKASPNPRPPKSETLPDPIKPQSRHLRPGEGTDLHDWDRTRPVTVHLTIEGAGGFKRLAAALRRARKSRR